MDVFCKYHKIISVKIFVTNFERHNINMNVLTINLYSSYILNLLAD